MKLKRLLSRTVATTLKSFCCLSLAYFAGNSNAADTFIDGVAEDGTTPAPAVFNAETVADFSTGTQGWRHTRLGGIQEVGGVLQNTNPLGSNGETDAYVFVNVPSSLLPGEPDTFIVGALPGQYDIIQFDLRFDDLPPQPLRGRQFLQNGGGPVNGVNFYDNTAASGIPDLPLDNNFHTYTIVRDSGDNAWQQTYSRIRIDVVDGVGTIADLLGTNFSLDNVRLGRTTATEAFPFVEPATPNLILNGDLSDASNVVLGGTNTGAFNINGSNGNFGPFRGNTGDVDGWMPYNNNPDSIVEAVADGGALDLLNTSSGNQGSFYLDTHLSAGRLVLNSAGGYLNGVIQSDILNGVTVDETATYELAFDIDFNSNRPANPSSNFKVALTVGSGASATDPGTAVAGSLFDEQLSNITAGDRQTVSISGAALKAAQDSGAPVNLIVQSLTSTTINNFPGGTPVANDHTDSNVFTQVILDNFSLLVPFVPSVGDVNKDGVVTQADVDLAQDYLDGNGGETAAVRQGDLSGLGTSAEILASLNLNDFDLTSDATFDAADVAAIQALVPNVLLGDVDLSGSVDFLDIAPFISVLSSNGSQPEADCDENGVVDFLDIAPFIAILSGA